MQISIVDCSKNNYNYSATKKTSKPVEPVVKCSLVAVDCNKRRVDENREDGELMELDEETSTNITHPRDIWISSPTKQRINQAIGKDTKTCQLCSHVATTTRRHKKHCRGHFLQFMCPCGYHSFLRK